MNLVLAQALLSSGTPQSKIAEQFGVSPAFISQLISEGKLYPPPVNTRDQRWDEIESKLLERTVELVEHTTNPKALLGLLRMANSAVRRGNSTNDIQQNSITNIDIVQINLPDRMRAKLQIDQQKRITAINDTPVITIDQKDLSKLSKEESKNVQPALPNRSAEYNDYFD